MQVKGTDPSTAENTSLACSSHPRRRCLVADRGVFWRGRARGYARHGPRNGARPVLLAAAAAAAGAGPVRPCQEHRVLAKSILLLRCLHQVMRPSLYPAEAAEEDPYALGAKATTICQLVTYRL